MSIRCRIVAIKRNPIYNIRDYRLECQDVILHWLNDFVPYDTTGCLKWQFPALKDKPFAFYCSEALNHWCICQSGGKMNLRGDKSKEDNVMPYTIQCNKELEDVPLMESAIRELDYVITNGGAEDLPADAIRFREVGILQIGRAHV